MHREVKIKHFPIVTPSCPRTHTPDVCALRSLGHGCVQEVKKNYINTVRFLTQTARFVS